MFTICKHITMKTLKQIDIARITGLTRGFISRVLNAEDNVKPSWPTAKKLGKASKTDPVLWANKDLEKLRPLFGLPVLKNKDIKSACNSKVL